MNRNSGVRDLIRGLVKKQETVTLSGEEFFRLMDEAAERGAKQAREEFMKPFIEKIEEAGKRQTEQINKAGQEALDSVEQAGRDLEETGEKTLSNIRELGEATEKIMSGLDSTDTQSGNGIHVNI